MLPQPKSKFSDLLDAINKVVSGESDPSQLAFIEIQAKKLEQSSYPESKILLGMIASYKRNLEDVQKFFNAAIKYTGGDKEIYLNFAKALSNMDYYELAIDISNDLVSNYPDDLDILGHALRLNLSAFNFEGAIQVAEKLDKLGVSLPQDLKDELYSAHFSELLDHYNISWKDITVCYRKVADHLFNKGYYFNSKTKSFDLENVFVEFDIHGDHQKAIMAEEELISFISDQPYNPVEQIVTFGCKPL